MQEIASKYELNAGEIERSIVSFDAEGATAPETLRQSGPHSILKLWKEELCVPAEGVTEIVFREISQVSRQRGHVTFVRSLACALHLCLFERDEYVPI